MRIDRLRSLLAEDEDLRDVMIRAFLRREAIGQRLAADLVVLGDLDDPRTRAILVWAHADGLDVRTEAVTADGDPGRTLDCLGLQESDLPVVVLPDGRVLCAPTTDELDATRPPGTGSRPR